MLCFVNELYSDKIFFLSNNTSFSGRGQRSRPTILKQRKDVQLSNAERFAFRTANFGYKAFYSLGNMYLQRMHINIESHTIIKIILNAINCLAI